MNDVAATRAGTAPRTNLFDLERGALRDLVTLVESRATADASAKAANAAALTAAERELNRSRKQASTGRERDTTQANDAHQAAMREIAEKFKADSDANDAEYADAKRKAAQEGDQAEQSARTVYQDARWTADSLYEAAEKESADDREATRRSAAATADRIAHLWKEAEAPLARAALEREEVEVPTSEAAGGLVADPAKAIEEQFAAAEHALADLRDSRTLKLATMGGFFLVLVPVAILAAVPSLFVESKVIAIAGGAVAALAIAFGLHWLLRRSALKAAEESANAFGLALARVSEARVTLLKRADSEHARRLAEAGATREQAKGHAEAIYKPLSARIAARRAADTQAAADKHARAREKLRAWRTESTDAADERHARALRDIEAKYEKMAADAERKARDFSREAKDALDSAEQAISTEWRDGQDRIGRAINKLRANGLEHFPDWSSPFWYSPPAAIKVPAGVRFGDFDIDLAKLPGGLPDADEEMPTLPLRMKVPAFLPFPDRCSLLLKAKDQGRQRAVQALQAIMLRLLTAIPPGKLRFTIIDPVGLGENFAAFMHLADYDEQLVGSRIWTEPQQIERRLADVTAHMETVIQKYLRNQYKTIEEYNAFAGEVAEPFRVLVVANFPANFTLDACRRLVSIVNSGPSCGVYTLITHDPKHPVPQGFNLKDLEDGSINLVWKDEAFVWSKDDSLKQFPLIVETPPSLEEVTRLVRLVGERSKDANRVEVPFDYVAPRAVEIWEGDSRNGVSVAIGRAGATKRQMMELGRGTAQHALVAGKTGSGKSTLLHAMITNLALNYSPDEIELYLIDFKKGVEFKAYAQNRLPHARAVAIESEREFGLSVLQRLDAVLKERGDLFRDAGVNSVAEYREFLDRESGAKNRLSDDADTRLTGSVGKFPTLPRIMLVVDEFQEFFVEDDRVAQECALLLDRLVRQGRAFGLHVLLGSQTLGGAYSLARSTIDQMAIRIALQCSDADAQLILSKENTAARMLSRPGEAIYNDQNGLVEGNDLFQVVWLADDKREKLLGEIRQRADAAGRADAAPLVFEGNVPSAIEKNVPLKKLLDAPAYPTGVRAGSAWLGDAVAIKDPTAAVFRPAGGQNVLMVGQQDEAPLAIVSSMVVSLASQYPPGGVRFFVLDGTLDDDPNAGLLARVAGALPHDVKMIDRNDLGPALEAVAVEVQARQKKESADRTPCFVFLQGVQRFRELRKEEDFGFGRRGADKVTPPAEHLAAILRDGPTVHVHVILWADTPTNLGRVVDRAGMREFGLRILFQMGVNDSSTLMDSPAAARLGRNRALYLTEESTQPEKFRPYGLPTKEWLASVKERLGKKNEPEA